MLEKANEVRTLSLSLSLWELKKWLRQHHPKNNYKKAPLRNGALNRLKNETEDALIEKEVDTNQGSQQEGPTADLGESKGRN